MPQPRHTELSILESYLLPASPLPTILPYTAFLQLVPTQHRSHPHLKRLYRDLQFQRNVDIDTVRQNIDREVAKGATLKTGLAHRLADQQDRSRHPDKHTRDAASKKRKRDAKASSYSKERTDELTGPAELEIDTTYLTTTLHPAHTSTSLPAARDHPLTAGTRKHHSTGSLLTALESARLALETEIEDLEAESADLLVDMNEIVGSLSDLRYGRFARPPSGNDGEDSRTVEEEVLDALTGLQRRIEETIV